MFLRVLCGKTVLTYSLGYSPADLPILAKNGREWDPDNAGSLTPVEMTLRKWFG